MRRRLDRTSGPSRPSGPVVTTGLLALGALMLAAWRGDDGVRDVPAPDELLGRPTLIAESGPTVPVGPVAEPSFAAGPEHAADASALPALPEERRWFDGRPIQPTRVMTMRVTAYSPDARSCAPFDDNITASGYSVWTNGMKLVAADTRLLPFGSLVSIPGYDEGRVVPVLDRGARIKGHRLDVLLPTHEHARRWGVRHLEVVVWEYADEGLGIGDEG